jgi:hypothetical protein
MNGVAKLFTHYDGYARAEKISGGSKNWGLTFCVGTWSEGGDKMGKRVKFDGPAEPDHVPGLVGDTGIRRAGTAYIVANMKALLRRANEEVG